MTVPITRTINILKPKLLVVEGTHEKKFFNRLLILLRIDDIQVEEIGGKYFGPVISEMKRFRGADKLVSIGITRDADKDFAGMFKSVQDSLAKGDLPVPARPCELAGDKPKVTIFVFPNNKDIGSLENLCIESVEGDPVLDCVENYLTCLEKVQGATHPHPFKARVQVYCAKEKEGDIHMGIAAEKDVWQWRSPAFDSIKTFITSL